MLIVMYLLLGFLGDGKRRVGIPAICLDSAQESKLDEVELELVEVVLSLSEIDSIANKTKTM